MISGVVGIDPGLTQAGFVRFDIEKRQMTHCTVGSDSKKGTVWRRYQLSMARFRELVAPGDVVFMEDYAFGIRKDVSSLVTMAEIGGLIKMVCFANTKTWPFPVPIASAKTFVMGKAGKDDDLRLRVYKTYKVDFPTKDETVAFSVALLGSCALGLPRMFGEGDGWTGHQLDVIKRLLKIGAKGAGGCWGRNGRSEELQTFAKKLVS